MILFQCPFVRILQSEHREIALFWVHTDHLLTGVRLHKYFQCIWSERTVIHLDTDTE